MGFVNSVRAFGKLAKATLPDPTKADLPRRDNVGPFGVGIGDDVSLDRTWSLTQGALSPLFQPPRAHEGLIVWVEQFTHPSSNTAIWRYHLSEKGVTSLGRFIEVTTTMNDRVTPLEVRYGYTLEVCIPDAESVSAWMGQVPGEGLGNPLMEYPVGTLGELIFGKDNNKTSWIQSMTPHPREIDEIPTVSWLGARDTWQKPDTIGIVHMVSQGGDGASYVGCMTSHERVITGGGREVMTLVTHDQPGNFRVEVTLTWVVPTYQVTFAKTTERTTKA
jgi:hypothetical protein